jgi:hypothetical protein
MSRLTGLIPNIADPTDLSEKATDQTAILRAIPSVGATAL